MTYLSRSRPVEWAGGARGRRRRREGSGRGSAWRGPRCGVTRAGSRGWAGRPVAPVPREAWTREGRYASPRRGRGGYLDDNDGGGGGPRGARRARGTRTRGSSGEEARLRRRARGPAGARGARRSPRCAERGVSVGGGPRPGTCGTGGPPVPSRGGTRGRTATGTATARRTHPEVGSGRGGSHGRGDGRT